MGISECNNKIENYFVLSMIFKIGRQPGREALQEKSKASKLGRLGATQCNAAH